MRRRSREPYDQLMALYPPDGSTDASIRIFNNDGSEAGACGNGMRCVAALVSEQTGRSDLKFATPAGTVACWRERNGLFTVDMGEPRLRWDEIPLAREMPDTRAIDLEFELTDGTWLRAPSVVSMGNPHVIFWVDDPQAYDLCSHRSAAGARSAVSRARQYHARCDAGARSYRHPHLGARRRPHQGLRLGGLRRRGRGGADSAAPSAR